MRTILLTHITSFRYIKLKKRGKIDTEFKMTKMGAPTGIPKDTEAYISDYLKQMHDFGCPYDTSEIPLFVKSILDEHGVDCPKFKDNLPSHSWIRR